MGSEGGAGSWGTIFGLLGCIHDLRHVQEPWSGITMPSVHIDYVTLVIFPTSDRKGLMKLPLVVSQLVR